MFENFNPHVLAAGIIFSAIFWFRVWRVIQEEFGQSNHPSRPNLKDWAVAGSCVFLGGILTIVTNGISELFNIKSGPSDTGFHVTLYLAIIAAILYFLAHRAKVILNAFFPNAKIWGKVRRVLIILLVVLILAEVMGWAVTGVLYLPGLMLPLIVACGAGLMAGSQLRAVQAMGPGLGQKKRLRAEFYLRIIVCALLFLVALIAAGFLVLQVIVWIA